MTSASSTEHVGRYSMPAGELKRRIWRWANATASGGTATLLGVIATRYNMETGLVCPSIETIMGDYEKAWHNVNSGQYFAPSERAVRSWLVPLKASGIVSVVQNKGKKNRHGHRQASWWSSNQYVMDFTKVLVNGEIIDHDFLAPLDAPSNSAGEPAVQSAAITSSSNQSVQQVKKKNDVAGRADAIGPSYERSHATAEAEGTGTDFAYQRAAETGKRISTDYPGFPPANIGVLAREFRKALETYSERDLVAALTHWFEGRRNGHGKGMLNPAGRLMSELGFFLDLAAESPDMRYTDFRKILDRGTFLSDAEAQAFDEFEQYWQGEDAIRGGERDKAQEMGVAHFRSKQAKLKQEAFIEEERLDREYEVQFQRDCERWDAQTSSTEQQEVPQESFQRRESYERWTAETPSSMERFALAAIRRSEIKAKILAAREANAIQAVTHVLPAESKTTQAPPLDEVAKAAMLKRWRVALRMN